MMNKKNLWFLTLFSLVIVLSIYYVTMPEDLLAASTGGVVDKKGTTSKVNTEIQESDTIAALKVEDTSKTNDIFCAATCQRLRRQTAHYRHTARTGRGSGSRQGCTS